MRKLTILFALLCASMMSWATQYCGETITATDGVHTAVLTCTNPSENTYVMALTSDDANFTGLRGDNMWCHINGNGTTYHMTDSYTWDAVTKTVTFTITSTAVPDMYTPLYLNMNDEITFTTIQNQTFEWPASCGSITPDPDPEPTEIYDVNFALQSQGGVASAKSGNDAGLANNGNTGDRWWSETAEMTDAEKNDQWWQVDLGQRRIFNTIQIVWEGAWGKSFDIQISDDGDAWTIVKEIRNQNIPGPFPYEQTIDLETNKTARYVRFQGIERGTGYAYSFWEFRVLLPGVSVLTSIDLTAAKEAKIGIGVALTATPKDQNGQPMAESVSYEITPAGAGHMSGNTYIPDQMGNASIVAYIDEVRSSAVTVFGVPLNNLALSTNIVTDNKIIAQSEFAPNGTDAFHAVDGNMSSDWQGSPTNGNVNDSREYDCWFVVDLGAFYNIDLVALHFEGACSELYHIDFSANNSDWNLGYNLVGTEGINARNDYWTELDNNTKVRYVRFWSTKAATGWGMKMHEFEVYGTEWTSGDEEKPVMVSASLVSSTINSAVIAVEATDNEEVARFHVVDATNSIDANFTPSEGKITITGLTHATDYNFTITAKDASNNESANSIVVPVATPFDGSINLALNQPCEGGYYDNNPAESADKANDGNNGTSWVTYGDHAAALDWWVVDLGNVYNLTNITALWANDAYATQYILQARVDAPTNEDKADDAAWVTLETVSGVTAGEERSTNVSGVGRYVRFRATAFAGGFFRLREFRVFGSGIATVDTEAPVMTSASLVSNTDAQAVITVAATDNQGIANYHVVDADNSFDGNFVAEAGNITVTGLNGGTVYNFTITAIDFFGNESANSKSVEVTTTAHYTEPQAACPAPTWDASLVKAIYSPTYSADCNFADWGGCVAYTSDTYGKKFEMGATCWGFGLDGFTLNCLNMLKLHVDIWIENSASLRLVPIFGGTGLTTDDTHGKFVNIDGQQWNSIDLTLASDFAGLDLSSIFQFKIDNANGLTIWIANAYFYRETALADDEVPTNAAANLTETGFYSVKITASAEDNSGAVTFAVKNGDVEVATGAAASGATTTITVNNLTPGTAYNFNVIVADEAGNALDPIAVAASTLALPDAAPNSSLSADVVKAIYSDQYTPAVTVINFNEDWWQHPELHAVELGGNHALCYDNIPSVSTFGWAFAEPKINASGFQKLHLSIYPVVAGTIDLYPVKESGGTLLQTSNTLVAGTWNDVELDYTGETFDEVFKQLGFTNYSSLGAFIIDNVYFFKESSYTRDELTVGKIGTLCVDHNVIAMQGATFYQLAGKDANGKLEFGEVTELEAGKPYIFESTTGSIALYYGETVQATPLQVNGMVGSYENIEVTITDDNKKSVMYISGNKLWDCSDYETFTNKKLQVVANRAYIYNYNEIGAAPAHAPGRRYITVGKDGQNATTDVDLLNAAEAPVKMIIDGKMYILRGEKLYNANGQLVK